jgi:hypothetical protein
MGRQLEQLDLGLNLFPELGHLLGVDRRRRTGQRTRNVPGMGRPVVAGGGLRFAFYGRVSTMEHQDADSACGWQRAIAM